MSVATITAANHPSEPDAVEAVVVGAGAAGLGAAASLRSRGVEVVVLERYEEVGASWRRRYPAVRLNTLRRMSALPGLPISRAAGRWPSRDAFVDYLEHYAKHHALQVRGGVQVERIDRREDGTFLLTTSSGALIANYVVVATGFNHSPYVPRWPGLEAFEADFSHASAFVDAARFRDLHVLIVGLGNTGLEIAVQLVAGGAASVRVSMRTPPNILRRSNYGLPATVIGRLGEYPPAALHDRFGVVLQRLLWGDLRRYGIARAPYGIATEIEMKGLGPLVDNGFVAALKAGRVMIVPVVESFAARSVRLLGGETIVPDAVIAATGYRFGLEPLVGHLDVLRPGGLPALVGGDPSPHAPGLYFNGYWAPLRGQLPAMKRTSRRIARSIQRERRRARASSPGAAAAQRSSGPAATAAAEVPSIGVPGVRRRGASR